MFPTKNEPYFSMSFALSSLMCFLAMRKISLEKLNHFWLDYIKLAFEDSVN